MDAIQHSVKLRVLLPKPQPTDQEISFIAQRNTDKTSESHYLCRAKTKADNDKIKGVIVSAFNESGWPVKDIQFDRGCYAVKLNKKLTIKQIIKHYNYHTAQSETVADSKKTRRHIICISRNTNINTDGQRKCDLNILRQLITAQHLHQLISSRHGVCVSFSGDCPVRELIHQVLNQAGIHLGSDNPQTEALEQRLCAAKEAEFCEDGELGGDSGEWVITFPEAITVQGSKIEKWVLDRELPMYETLGLLVSSINTTQAYLFIKYHHLGVGELSDVLLYEALPDVLDNPMHELLGTGAESNGSCFSIYQLEYRHHTIVVGGVKLRSDSIQSEHLREYITSRKSHLIQSSEEKYGAAVHEDDFWKKRIDDLTLTSIKFELLSRASNQNVTLPGTLSSSNSGDVKIGSFIMYNCSRLSTLFNNYQLEVNKGTYPELCELEDVDFTLLKTEDEWILVFHYINVFPLLIDDIRDNLKSASHLSQVARFIHKLSRDFSTYYSRTHILGENRPYLIPTMMARLWLLKIIQDIFTKALSMFDISPYDSM